MYNSAFVLSAFITISAKGGYFFDNIGLSVCLFVCGKHYSKRYKWIGTKFYGGVLGGTMIEQLIKFLVMI